MKKLKNITIAIIITVMFVFAYDINLYAGEVGNTEEVCVVDSLYAGTIEEINPLYSDLIISNESEEEILDTSLCGAEAYAPFDNINTAGYYIKKKMIQHCTNFSIVIPDSFGQVNDVVNNLYECAYYYSDSCGGTEGDAIAFNIYYRSVNWRKSGGKLYLAYTINYLNDATQESMYNEALIDAMKSLGLADKSDAEKVKIIHDYICDKVDYDYEGLRTGDILCHSAYAALCKGKAVCQGYSLLFYRMCKEAGLSVRIIPGKDNLSAAKDNHAWNIVAIDGIYYNIDVTWDGQDELTKYTYYLKNNVDFVRHYRNEAYVAAEFNDEYPISVSSYNEEQFATDFYVKYKPNGANGNEYSEEYDADDTAIVKKNTFSRAGYSFLGWNTNKDGSGEDYRAGDLLANINTCIILWANWSLNNYSITYYLDGGTNNSDNPGNYNVESAKIHLCSPEKEGYRFLGWYKDSAYTTSISEIAAGSTGNLSIYAKWQKNPKFVNKITLNKKSKTLKKGQTYILKATVGPANADNKKVSWRSTNKKVVTVSSSGKLVAKGKGTATIVCQALDGSGVKATCKVTVKQMVTKLTLNKTKLTLKRGKTYTLKVKVTPSNANCKKVKWYSSNKKVVTVNAKGKLTAKKKGKANITCAATDGSGMKVVCKVLVK